MPDPNDPLYGRAAGPAAASDAAGLLLQSWTGYEKPPVCESSPYPAWDLGWGIFLPKRDAERDAVEPHDCVFSIRTYAATATVGGPYIFEVDQTHGPLQFSPRDLSFSEGENRKVEVIAAVSGVPVTLLKANDPNLASAQVGFASYMR